MNNALSIVQLCYNPQVRYNVVRNMLRMSLKAGANTISFAFHEDNLLNYCNALRMFSSIKQDFNDVPIIVNNNVRLSVQAKVGAYLPYYYDFYSAHMVIAGKPLLRAVTSIADVEKANSEPATSYVINPSFLASKGMILTEQLATLNKIINQASKVKRAVLVTESNISIQALPYLVSGVIFDTNAEDDIIERIEYAKNHSSVFANNASKSTYNLG